MKRRESGWPNEALSLCPLNLVEFRRAMPILASCGPGKRSLTAGGEDRWGRQVGRTGGEDRWE